MLQHRYGIKRVDIIENFLKLADIPTFCIENADELKRLLTTAQENTFDLSDLLIAHHCKTHRALPVITPLIKRQRNMNILSCWIKH